MTKITFDDRSHIDHAVNTLVGMTTAIVATMSAITLVVVLNTPL